MKQRKARFTKSSGNVFLDIGFPPDEAKNLAVRAQLMIYLRDLIERRKLSQVRAAKLFGVTQPRVSDLVRGKIHLFSVETLMGMLWRAGIDVTIHLKPRAA